MPQEKQVVQKVRKPEVRQVSHSYANVAKGIVSQLDDMPLMRGRSAQICPPKLKKRGREYSGAEDEVVPLFSTVLRDGAVFQGYQRSEESKYRVEIQLHKVDLDQSYVCGYLNIIGLTEDYDDLTTFFEGEVIGPKYSFVTSKWNATVDKDQEHWEKFRGWVPFRKTFQDEDVKYDFSNKDCLFMRWKERFLVPDYRLRTIDGASFAGFYYLCFCLSTKQIVGYYFHNRSVAFQELRLNYVEDNGYEAFEFC